jgi:hypothetical protein
MGGVEILEEGIINHGKLTKKSIFKIKLIQRDQDWPAIKRIRIWENANGAISHLFPLLESGTAHTSPR